MAGAADRRGNHERADCCQFRIVHARLGRAADARCATRRTRCRISSLLLTAEDLWQPCSLFLGSLPIPRTDDAWGVLVCGRTRWLTNPGWQDELTDTRWMFDEPDAATRWYEHVRRGLPRFSADSDFEVEPMDVGARCILAREIMGPPNYAGSPDEFTYLLVAGRGNPSRHGAASDSRADQRHC